MTYRIPRKIKLGGQLITVKFHKKIMEGKTVENYGFYHCEKKKLHMTYGMDYAEKQSTFIHESLEAINAIYNIGLSHKNIELLEMGIMDLITNNKIKFENSYDQGR